MKIIKTQDYSPDQVITQTVQVLKSGGLVIFPSDTVYGLLVDATHQPAVQKLIDFKNRPPGKAISTFVGNFDRLFQVASVRRLLKAQAIDRAFFIFISIEHYIKKLKWLQRHMN